MMRYTLTILDPVTLMHRYVSPSVTPLLGYSPEEFNQIPFYQLVDPSQSEWVKQIAEIGLAEYKPERVEGKFYTDEFQLIAKDGSRIWVESTSGLSEMKKAAIRKLSEFQGILQKKSFGTWKVSDYSPETGSPINCLYKKVVPGLIL
jgi:PAS domain S-box-containing protein